MCCFLCFNAKKISVDTGKAYVQDCSPFQLDLLYLKDCGECEVPSAASKAAGDDDDGGGGDHGSGSHSGGSGGVFDARLYAKDDLQLQAELAEAVDALSARAAALEAENDALKEALAKAQSNLRKL